MFRIEVIRLTRTFLTRFSLLVYIFICVCVRGESCYLVAERHWTFVVLYQIQFGEPLSGRDEGLFFIATVSVLSIFTYTFPTFIFSYLVVDAPPPPRAQHWSPVLRLAAISRRGVCDS